MNCAWDDAIFQGEPRFVDTRKAISIEWRLNPAPIDVYEAFDRAQCEHVWVKSFPWGYGVAEYEYSRLLQLHALVPHVMRVYDLFVGPSYVAYSAERLNNTTLRTYLDCHGPRANRTPLLRLLAHLVRAVDAVHRSGVVHHDVRPENVFMRPDGTIALTGFAPEEQPQSIDSVFRHDIMWYEAVDGTPAGDIYSVGAILFQVLRGNRFFPSFLRSSPDALLPPDVPADLRELCCAMLDPDPKQRPGAGEILSVLEARIG